MKRLYVAIGLVLTALIAAGCGQTDTVDDSKQAGRQVSEPSTQQVAAADSEKRPDRTPLVKGPVSPEGLQAILGTGDLGVGANRVGFVITSPDGFVVELEASVTTRYGARPGSSGEVRQTAKAELQPWPYGSRGMYATQLEFDRAGEWGLDITTGEGTVQLFFEVLDSPSAPAVGDPAIASKTKTMADVESIQQLTTGSLGDPDLYQRTIADAVLSGDPTVVVFASPAFCTNAVCGPQVEVLQELKDGYAGQASFIHVDFYDNPDEIQGDLERARISPVVLEWGLPSIEWTFVIDRDGIVSERFEGFATFTEVEDALKRVM